MSRPDTHWSEQSMEMSRKEGTYIGTKSGLTDRRFTRDQRQRGGLQSTVVSKEPTKAGK